MTDVQVDTFETTLQKTNIILKAIEDRFGWNDRHRAYLALRAVLQTLRDRLTVEHAAALGAQLPILVRGVYYEGWRPADTPLKMNKDQFIGEVDRQIEPLSYDQSTEDLIRGVIAIIQDYTDPHEMRKIKGTLPSEIQAMLGVPY